MARCWTCVSFGLIKYSVLQVSVVTQFRLPGTCLAFLLGSQALAFTAVWLSSGHVSSVCVCACVCQCVCVCVCVCMCMPVFCLVSYFLCFCSSSLNWKKKKKEICSVCHSISRLMTWWSKLESCTDRSVLDTSVSQSEFMLYLKEKRKKTQYTGVSLGLYCASWLSNGHVFFGCDYMYWPILGTFLWTGHVFFVCFMKYFSSASVLDMFLRS